MENTITLVPYSSTHFDDLVRYTLNDAQRRFTALPEENLVTRNILADPDKHAVSIMAGAIAVGFFVFDAGAERKELSDNPHAILLRSLSIHPDYQNKGIGQQAMQAGTSYVRRHLPGYNEIVLTVNCDNAAAYHVYMKAGFTDTRKIREGRNGPQHVLVSFC